LDKFTKTNPLAIYAEINRNRTQHVEEAVHIMSEWIEDYQDLSKAMIPSEKGEPLPFMEYIESKKKLPDQIIVDGKIIPLFGLVEVLATSRLLGDIVTSSNFFNFQSIREIHLHNIIWGGVMKMVMEFQKI